MQGQGVGKALEEDPSCLFLAPGVGHHPWLVDESPLTTTSKAFSMHRHVVFLLHGCLCGPALTETPIILS